MKSYFTSLIFYFAAIVFTCHGLHNSIYSNAINSNYTDDAEIKIEMMRLAGRQSFNVKKRAGSKKNVWLVDRIERDERNAAVNVFKNIYRNEGSSLTIDLPKIQGKETIYTITSQSDKIKVIRTVRIFPADEKAVFTFQAGTNPPVKSFIVVPKLLNARTKLVVVMSGLQRNAEEYLDSWTNWAVSNNYIAVSPLFDEENWKGARSYNLGNVFTGNEGRGELNPKSEWTFTIVDELQKKLHTGFNLKDSSFDIFGHSAGAQFVHRFVLFCPDVPVRFAIAANSGWYTLPDLNKDYSYGLKNPLLKFNSDDVISWTEKNLVIMRGTNDTSRDEVLRKTDEAEEQGENRFERAGYMYNQAIKLNKRTSWKLIDVKNVEHDQQKMAVAAQDFLKQMNRKK